MKNKTKDIINKILRILCCLVLVLGVLFMGTPLEENFIPVNIFIYLIAIIYFVINFEKKIFTNKFDILLFIFCHSLIIPIIFGTAINIEDTIINILNNISIFWLYVVIKNLFVTEKQKSLLLNTSIFCGILLIILGIDDLTSKTIYDNMTEYFNWLNVANKENRLCANVEYPNALASILSFNLFICLYQYLKSKKVIYFTIIFVLLTGILLTASRAMILFVVLFYIIALIILRNKEITLESIITLSIATIMAAIYERIFSDLSIEQKYIQIWLIFIGMIFFVYIIQIFVKRIENKILKICSNKKVIVIIPIVVLTIISIFIIALQQTEPLVLFESGTNQKKEERVIYGIKANTKYNMQFDIKAISKDDTKNIYTIVVAEKNKYNDTLKEHKFTFGNFEDKKIIEFISSEETKLISIYFKNNNPTKAMGLTINKLVVNDKEEVLEYKLIPIKIMQIVETLQYENKSVSERITHMKDGMKIIKKTWLLGGGTDCWIKYYPEVQEYKYGANQIHCFPEKVWMESGVIGFLSYMGLLIICGITIIKHRKNLFIVFLGIAIGTIHAHSFVDFDLTFRYIFLIAFVFIGMLNLDEPRKKTKLEYINLLWITILVICCFYCILNYTIQNKVIFLEKEEVVYSKICPYSEKILKQNTNKIYAKISISEEESAIIRKQIEKQYTYQGYSLKKLLDRCPSEKNIEFAYEKLKEYSSRQELRLNVKDILNKEILLIADNLDNIEYKLKFCQLIVDYKQKNLAEIKDTSRNRYSKEEIKKYEEDFDKVCLEAERIIKYWTD